MATKPKKKGSNPPLANEAMGLPTPKRGKQKVQARKASLPRSGRLKQAGTNRDMPGGPV